MSTDAPAQLGPVADPGSRRVIAGLYVSATRCLLLYVALPLFGLTGRHDLLLAPVDLALHALAIVCVVTGARSLWRGRRRVRFAYSALAVVVVFISLVSIAATLDALVR